jgi:predicted Zn finger-like uncharacterized protein
MRTRCPACSTVFRVTSEQLRLRAGKVRCGHCQEVFNAFDGLVSELNEFLMQAPPVEERLSSEDTILPEAATSFDEPEAEPEALVTEGSKGVRSETSDSLVATVMTNDSAEKSAQSVFTEASGLPINTETVLVQAPLEAPLVESPEESTQAARQAGLVAARELGDTGSFNRWSAGTLASDGRGGFDSDSNRRAVWPFILVAMLLFIGLFGQLLYYFRTDIVLRFPSTAGLYELAAVDVPLPRDSALVSIETSDLQSDNARGLFVLQATLKNRAGHAQAWPALELSLTDINDAVVSRRVIFAADYLPPGTTSDAFPANGDMAVKLWVEAKGIAASGYRLYIFYP